MSSVSRSSLLPSGATAAKTNASPNAGSGAYSAEDFAAGTYTYSFTCGSTTARGTFTIG